MKNNKTKKIIRYTFLLGLFLVVLGTSYALFTVTLTGKKLTRIKTGDFSLKLTDKYGNEETEGYAINLEDAYPTEDKVGINITPYEFIVENDGNVPASYELVINSTGDMDTQYIKYSLTEKDYLKKANGTYYMGGLYKDSVKCNAYDVSRCSISSPTLGEGNEKTIHTTTLLPGEKMAYELRLWIDWSATEIDINNKTYEANVVIKATQAESIYEGSVGDNANYTFYKDGTLIIHGNGPIETIVDGVNIDHNGPYLDILAKYFEENGISKNYTDKINIYHEALTSTLTGGIPHFDEYYSYCTDNNIDCMQSTINLANNIPYRITRVVLNEGITSVKKKKYLFSITGDYMLTLPSTLEELDDYESYTNNFQNYKGYALIFPPPITSIGQLNTTSASYDRSYGYYLEYIDYSNLTVIGTESLFINSIDGVVNISDSVTEIQLVGITIRNVKTLNIPNSVNRIGGGGIYLPLDDNITINIDNTYDFVHQNYSSDWYEPSNTTGISINYLR